MRQPPAVLVHGTVAEVRSTAGALGGFGVGSESANSPGHRLLFDAIDVGRLWMPAMSRMVGPMSLTGELQVGRRVGDLVGEWMISGFGAPR
jgi:hypothetical protein